MKFQTKHKKSIEIFLFFFTNENKLIFKKKNDSDIQLV